MWELDYVEAECQRINAFKLVLGKIYKSPLACKIKVVNPKGNQPWIFTVRTITEAPILWSSDVKSWLIGKDPDAGKDWKQNEKAAAEDKMFRK